MGIIPPMGIPYEYRVKNFAGARDMEDDLSNLSRDGWEPINFARDSAGQYEVVLRREREDQSAAVLEHLEATMPGEPPTPLTE